MTHRICLSLLLVLLNASVSAQPQVRLSGPNGGLEAVFSLRDGKPVYQLRRKGALLTERSAIGITVNGDDRSTKLTALGLSGVTRVDRHLELRLGKQKDDVIWQEGVVTARDERGPRLLVDVRMFDECLAYRYRLPIGEKGGSCHIDKEESSVKPPIGSIVWTQDYWNAITGCEGIFSSAPLGGVTGVRSGPVTVELPDGKGYLFVTEAGNFGLDYSGSKYLMGEQIQHTFAHDPKGFTIPRPNFVSPWRVVLATKDLNGLVNQSVIAALVPAPDPKYFPKGVRTDWLKPGRCAWSFFTRGYHEGNTVKKEPEEQFIDIAGALGFEYNLVDAGWYGWKDGGRDQWAHMSDLVTRGGRLGVAQWAWIYYPLQLNNPANDWEQMRTFLDSLVRIGVKGVEMDFMDSESQERRRFYDTALRMCAERRLLIQFHGANIPTGESITWPNEMTREAIYGLENNLWFGVPARHYTALPFTRLVAGHGCFTPGYFGHRQELLDRSSWTMQLGTMAAYNTSLLQTPLAPEILQDALPASSPQREMMRNLPVSWDETMVLPGAKIGDLAPFARRKGNDWWVVFLNGELPRSYTAILSFLGTGSYDAILVSDDPDKNDAWKVSQRVVKKGDRLSFAMRDTGGFVAWLKAKRH